MQILYDMTLRVFIRTMIFGLVPSYFHSFICFLFAFIFTWRKQNSITLTHRKRLKSSRSRSPKDKYNLLCFIPHRKEMERNFIINTRHYHIHFSVVVNAAATAAAAALDPTTSTEAVQKATEATK